MGSFPTVSLPGVKAGLITNPDLASQFHSPAAVSVAPLVTANLTFAGAGSLSRPARLQEISTQAGFANHAGIQALIKNDDARLNATKLTRLAARYADAETVIAEHFRKQFSGKSLPVTLRAMRGMDLSAQIAAASRLPVAQREKILAVAAPEKNEINLQLEIEEAHETLSKFLVGQNVSPELISNGNVRPQTVPPYFRKVGA